MANRYWVGGPGTWDATAGTKWATTSGGAGGAAVPTASDDVFFDANSGANTVTVSGTRVGLTLNCTGFTGTLDGSGSLTISGNTTFAAGMTLSVTGTLTINAASTITANGQTWPGPTTFSGVSTKTLSGNFTSTGLVTLSATNQIVNGSNFIMNGGLTMNNSLAAGTALFQLGGGTWSGSGVVRNNLTFAGNSTISGTVSFGGTSTMAYSSGTIDATAANLTIGTNSSLTFDLDSNVVFDKITTATNSVTATLTTDLHCVDFENQMAGGQTVTVNGAGALIVTGDFTITGSNPGNMSGTALISLQGTGNISSTHTGSRIANNLTIASGANYSFASNVRYGGGTFTIETGATLNTANYELNIISANTVIDANGHTIERLHFETAGITISLASSLLVSVNFNASAATAASPIIFNSTSPGTQRTFTLLSSATQLVNFVNATDIDSSAGQTIIDWRGTLSNTVNWNALAGALQTVAHIF